MKRFFSSRIPQRFVSLGNPGEASSDRAGDIVWGQDSHHSCSSKIPLLYCHPISSTKYNSVWNKHTVGGGGDVVSLPFFLWWREGFSQLFSSDRKLSPQANDDTCLGENNTPESPETETCFGSQPLILGLSTVFSMLRWQMNLKMVSRLFPVVTGAPAEKIGAW